ncbi:hypothetical protein [Asanoa siamensis]|nr:hypothetical protein [Asanoa siamensis]
MSADETGPAVVEFGDDDASDGSDRTVVGRLRRLVGDRWHLLAGAVLAAAAGFVSLVATWYSMTMPVGEPDPTTGQPSDQALPFTVTDLGVLGNAYVLGLLLLAVTVVLTLFGPPPGRRYTRLAGISLAGGLVGVLVALTSSLGKSMERNFFYGSEGTFEVDTTTGLYAAYLAVVLAGSVLVAVGRLSFADLPPAAAPAAHPGADWAWQRPRQVRDEMADEVAAAAPLDLTVQPSRPFARPNGDDDRTR